MMPINKSNLVTKIFVFTFLVVLAFLIEYFGFADSARSLGQKLIHPLMTQNSRVIGNFFSPYLHMQSNVSAMRRIQDLELKYAEASSLLGEIEALREENGELRKLLENTDRKLEKSIVASPIVSLARPALGVGTSEGVMEGSMVIAGQTLVGVVSRVNQNQSEVSLLFNQDSQPIIARTESGVQGLIVGDGKRVLMTEIPFDANLELNERVVTMGQKGISKDVFIGRIQSIESQPNSSSKKAVLEQFISFYEVAIVEVKQ